MNVAAKKIISWVLTAIILLTLIIPNNAQASTPNDFSSHWAEAQLNKWIKNGIIGGYPDGTINPITAAD